MADAMPSSDSKGVVDESLTQRLKKQPRRYEVETSTARTDASDHQEEDQDLELRGQSMRGDQ